MNKILHFQLPLNERGNALISSELTGKFLRYVSERLNNEYVVVGSPFVPSIIDGDSVVYNCKMEEINFSEILDMINKG